MNRRTFLEKTAAAFLSSSATLSGSAGGESLISDPPCSKPLHEHPARAISRAAIPLVAPAYVPLQPGAVQPLGWLLDWAIAARDGITGYLDERHQDFGETWKPATPTTLELNKGWPLEMGAYWLDGALRLGYVLDDDALIRKAGHRLDLVVRGVNAGADSFLYWRSDKPDAYDPWPYSHIGRALVAYYEATGDSQILEALVRAYRNNPPRKSMVLNRICEADRAAANLDPMLETYSWSGERCLLDSSLAAVRSGRMSSIIDEWANGDFLPGHGVIFNENARAPALLYPWTGEPRFLSASVNAYNWVDSHHMLPHGLHSGEEYLCGIGAFRCTETCDITDYMWSQIYLMRIQGHRGFADHIERAFFNAGPAAVARDFQTMSYYQSPNRIDVSLPGEPAIPPSRSATIFGPFGCPSVRCCVGTISRLIPNYVIHMWTATHDGGLAAMLYGPCSVTTKVGGGIPIRLVCETAYPFEDTIRIHVHITREAKLPLYFRIPGWCQNPEVRVNNYKLNLISDRNGFVSISRHWNRGDIIQLRFPMTVEIHRGYETEYPQIEVDESRFRYYPWKRGAIVERQRLPYSSVSYGPLLFALPIMDLDPNTPVDHAQWKYALDNEWESQGMDVEIERKQMPAKWSWQLDAPLVLTIRARPFAWNPTDAQALPGAPVSGAHPEFIHLVPYGCTKFRISMFPVTQRAWARS